MNNGNGSNRDLWVMVDYNGQKTLFQMMEMGKGGDVLKVARDLHARAVVVDMALPALPALDEIPGDGHQTDSSTLIMLNVRSAITSQADSAAGAGHGDVRRARTRRERADAV